MKTAKEDALSTLPTATRQSWLVSPAFGAPALSEFMVAHLGHSLAPLTEGERPTAQAPQYELWSSSFRLHCSIPCAHHLDAPGAAAPPAVVSHVRGG